MYLHANTSISHHRRVTLALHGIFGENIPPYAILSHTWGDDEITWQDWQNHRTVSKKNTSGWAQIIGACRKAQDHGLDWLWVDTSCIDKSSSAEHTESINSMFAWYAKSEICFAYLVDVEASASNPEETLPQVRTSRWFTRGWTLQELPAPSVLRFYDKSWALIGSKDRSLRQEISIITGIQRKFLRSISSAQNASVAQKMAWVSKRRTSRVEDIAYCMIGLLDINMPLLYGEGAKAFTRLQEEIIRVSNDHTLFCWSWNGSVPPT